jgi:S1-C subfamily serine protease
VSVPDPAPPPVPHDARRRQSLRTVVRRAGPFVAGIVAAFVAITAWSALNPPPRPITSSDVRNAVASALASQTPAPAHGEAVYAMIQPSLVVIETDDVGTATTKPGHGIGSGVIVSDAGTVLTALHVVADAQRIQLTFADGSKSDAIIAGKDETKDIAVVQPVHVPAQFTPATLGNPAGLRIGSEAYVVGTPFGLAGSLSSGVVSALDRSFVQPTTKQTMTGLIQVDAAINPGNSGGPLLDRNGRVVGIVTALINPTNDDVFIGIGLAVPIDVAAGAAGAPAA